MFAPSQDAWAGTNAADYESTVQLVDVLQSHICPTRVWLPALVQVLAITLGDGHLVAPSILLLLHFFR